MSLCCLLPFAAITVSGLFGDHMVLQRDHPVSVWGTAAPGEHVAVTYDGAAASAATDATGRWHLSLPPMAAHSAGADLVIAGENRVVFHDVLVGEVWLCAGQSNMGFALRLADHAADEIAAADFPLIRHVWITRSLQETAQEAVATTGWKPASPQSAGSFSAVSYFFARELSRKLGVPIGLVVSSWPGTPIESWLSGPMLQSDPAFAVVGERWAEALKAYPAKKPGYDAAYAQWQALEPAETKTDPTRHAAFIKAHPGPALILGPGHPYTPSGVYNGMIAPLLPETIRGIIWYQGETNAASPPRALEYARMFRTWVTDLRANFGSPDLPFFWVQLPNLAAGNPAGTNWPIIRAGQAQALDLPGTGQAVTIDVGEPDNLHPPHKQPVGQRLARLAEAKVYGVPVEWSGPTIAAVERAGSAVRIRFSHAPDGLVVKGESVGSFDVAGADGHFVPGQGRVEGDSLLVSAEAVPVPTTVRYAWRNAPAAHLYNTAGLPAAPFEAKVN